MKKILMFLLALIVSFGAVTLTYANTTVNAAVPTTSDTKKIPVLFVLLSKKASIHATNQSGIYKLTLKGVHPHVLYFSDRPTRESGRLDTEKLISQWINGDFRKDPPNAVMEAIGFDEKTNQLKENDIRTHAIVLKNPVYDKKNEELSFDITVLQGDKKLPTTAMSHYVAIFIDSVCLTCIGG